MPPLYNTYGAWVLRSKCYKDKPKTELPKLIWSKLDWYETLSFVTILLSPKNHDRNLVISRSLSSDPLNPYFSLINMEIHPRSHLVISFNLESHLAIPLLIINTKNVCVVSLWWVTCPSGKEKEWSHSLGDLPRGKKWPHYNGWPTQVKKKMENGLILMGDLPRKYGLIVMGDLPRKGRVVSFLWVTYPGEEWPHSYGWPT